MYEYRRYSYKKLEVRQAVGVLLWWNINKLIAKLGDDDETIRNASERSIHIDRSLNVFHNTFQTNLTS